MKLLNRKDILSSKLKTIKVEIPEWGGSVLIKEPTGLERADYELICTKAADDDSILKTLRGICAAKSIVDESGNRLFSDEDITLLHETSANALDRIIDAYRTVALMSEGDIATAAKN